MRLFRLLLLIPLLLLGGCDPDEQRLTLRDVDRYTPALLQEALEPSWNAGRIDHRVLTGHYRDALELFEERLAEHGERSRPSLFRFPRQRIAFYANAYNGLALLAWLRAGAADGDTERTWDPAWEARTVTIDGEPLGLADLEARVLEEGGREALLLLSRGRRDSPLVPEKPFDGQLFESQQGAQLRMLLNEEGAFRDTSGAMVGPAWLRTLTEPLPDADAPPYDEARLAAFLHEYLGFSHPLRLEILRAAREGSLVPAEPDPRIAVPAR